MLAVARAGRGLRLGIGLGVAGALAGGLVLTIGVAVSVGAVGLPLATVWSLVAERLAGGEAARGAAAIVWEIRLPRVLLAGLVGAGLGLVGAALQGATRNPLADPHLMGISSGAAFGAILALLHTGLFLGLSTVPLMAFAGALAATGLVLAVVRVTGAASAERLVLAGVAVSFVVMAAANVLIFLGDPRAAHMVVFWMLGGLGLAQWGQLVWPLGVLVAAGGWLWAQAPRLDALALGDETAASLGIDVARFRLEVFAVAALVTGVMVAFSGLIGFVGLMVPHLVRMAIGAGLARVLPGSAWGGAVFLILADAGARVALAPEDLPIGVVTGLCGGLFFIWTMARRR